MARKKHNNHPHGAIPKSSLSSQDEYDIARNFQRIGSYKGTASSVSSTPSPEEMGGGDGVIESGRINSIPQYTDSNSFWGSFTHLDNKLSSLQSSNESAHVALRDNFENQINSVERKLSDQIDKKLPTQWYVWTVIGIVAIVSIIYFLSYSRLLDTSNNHSEQINSLERKVDANTFTIHSLEEDVYRFANEKQEAETRKQN